MEAIRVLEWGLSLVGAFAAASGVLWAVYRFGGQVVRAWRAMDRLHVEFGDDPIGKLLDIVHDIEASHGEFEIRQRIAERHLEIGIYVCQTDGKCTWTNDWLASAFDIDSKDMLGWGWLAAIDKSDQERVHEHWTKAVKEELPYSEEYWVDGERRWYAHTEAWPVKRRGKIICYVGNVIETRPPQEDGDAEVQ